MENANIPYSGPEPPQGQPGAPYGAQQPYGAQHPYVYQPYGAPGGQMPQPEKVPKKKKLLLMIGIAVILALVIVLLIVLAGGRGESGNLPVLHKTVIKAERLGDVFYLQNGKDCIVVENDDIDFLYLAPGGGFTVAEKSGERGTRILVGDENGENLEEITDRGRMGPASIRENGFCYEDGDEICVYVAKNGDSITLGKTDDLFILFADNSMTYLYKNQINEKLYLLKEGDKEPRLLETNRTNRESRQYPEAVSPYGNIVAWTVQNGAESYLYVLEGNEQIELGRVEGLDDFAFTADEKGLFYETRNGMWFKHVGKDPVKYEVKSFGYSAFTDEGSLSASSAEFEDLYACFPHDLYHFDRNGKGSRVCSIDNNVVGFNKKGLIYKEDDSLRYIKLNGAKASKSVKIAKHVEKAFQVGAVVIYINDDDEVYSIKIGDKEGTRILDDLDDFAYRWFDAEGRYVYLLPDYEDDEGSDLVRINLRNGKKEIIDTNVLQHSIETGNAEHVVENGFTYITYNDRDETITFKFCDGSKAISSNVTVDAED